jgi:hypothetical protein
MTRLSVISLLCALVPLQASAQNTVSQELLELSEEQRNAAFARLLRASEQNCDQVIRTLFVGALLGLDGWEVLCRNRNSYSLTLPAEWDAAITVLNCRDLSATSKMLLGRTGSKGKGTGCRIK